MVWALQVPSRSQRFLAPSRKFHGLAQVLQHLIRRGAEARGSPPLEPTSQVEMIWSPPHLLGVVGDFTCTSCWVAHQVFKWMRKSVQLSPFNTTQRNSKLRRQKVVCFQPHTTEARGHLQKEGPKSENRPPKETLLKSKGLVRSNSCGCWADLYKCQLVSKGASQ